MDFLRRLFGLGPKRESPTLEDAKTQPLDAVALAKALNAEARRHVMVGSALLESPDRPEGGDACFFMVVNSDGLNVLPDFSLLGVAEGAIGEVDGYPANEYAIRVFFREMINGTILDLLAVEGGPEAVPFQEAVRKALRSAVRAIRARAESVELAMTAGMMFGDLILLAQIGEASAHFVDQRHFEALQAGNDGAPNQGTGEDLSTEHEGEEGTSEQREAEGVHLISRPVPRDGYILLATQGLHRGLDRGRIKEGILNEADPQRACESLVAAVKGAGRSPKAGLVLLYFPPDFGSWR
jgi:hypothetical protein